MIWSGHRSWINWCHSIMKTYRAPWGKALVISSSVVTLIGLGLTCMIAKEIGCAWMLCCVPMLVIAGCLPFVVRDYGLTQDAILVRRLFWTTRLERVDLLSAEYLPKAMNRSLRTCGNGGAFVFSGWFWSKSLGHYRAFVTDLNHTVILRFAKRTVMVSPADPVDFVRELNGAPTAADQGC